MKLLALFMVLLLAAVCAGQRFPGFGGSFGFGALQNARDPRQNTGPVVFPPAPPDNGETSGVVVGASGYGFVPPQAGPSAGRLF